MGLKRGTALGWKLHLQTIMSIDLQVLPYESRCTRAPAPATAAAPSCSPQLNGRRPLP